MVNNDRLHNPMCDGDHCTNPAGEVRKYQLGGGANLILCFSCRAHENRYNYERGKEKGADSANWAQQDWNTAEVYSIK